MILSPEEKAILLEGLEYVRNNHWFSGSTDFLKSIDKLKEKVNNEKSN